MTISVLVNLTICVLAGIFGTYALRESPVKVSNRLCVGVRIRFVVVAIGDPVGLPQ